MPLKPKKKANIGMMQIPIKEILPKSVAASIGKTINRFARVELAQQAILCALLGISIKQARIVLRLSKPGMFIQAVKLLLKYHDITVHIVWGALNTALEKADAARNALAHSLFMQEPGTRFLKIQLTSNIWDLGNEYEPVHRALKPQGKAVNRAWLIEQRRYVEIALVQVSILQAQVLLALRTLNKRRQTEPSLDRRKAHS